MRGYRIEEQIPRLGTGKQIAETNWSPPLIYAIATSSSIVKDEPARVIGILELVEWNNNSIVL